jgi:hypothetical protein
LCAGIRKTAEFLPVFFSQIWFSQIQKKSPLRGSFILNFYSKKFKKQKLLKTHFMENILSLLTTCQRRRKIAAVFCSPKMVRVEIIAFLLVCIGNQWEKS